MDRQRGVSPEERAPCLPLLSRSPSAPLGPASADFCPTAGPPQVPRYSLAPPPLSRLYPLNLLPTWPSSLPLPLPFLLPPLLAPPSPSPSPPPFSPSPLWSHADPKLHPLASSPPRPHLSSPGPALLTPSLASPPQAPPLWATSPPWHLPHPPGPTPAATFLLWPHSCSPGPTPLT